MMSAKDQEIINFQLFWKSQRLLSC